MGLLYNILVILIVMNYVQRNTANFNCSEYEKILSDRVEKNQQTYCQVKYESLIKLEFIVECKTSDAYLKQKVKYMEHRYELVYEVNPNTTLLLPVVPTMEGDAYLFCFLMENEQLVEISEWLPRPRKSKNDTRTPHEQKSLMLTYCLLRDDVNLEMIKPGQNNELQFIGLSTGYRYQTLRFGGDMIVCKPHLKTLQLEDQIIKTFIALSTSSDFNYKFLFNDSIISVYDEYGISRENLGHIRLLESGSTEIDAHENDTRNLNCSTTFPVQELILSYNNLEDDTIYLNVDLFPRLKYIDLSSNEFTRFPRLFYQHCLPHQKYPSKVVTLKKLNLFSNVINNLSTSENQHNVKMVIKILDLSYNSIENWSDVNIFDSEYLTVKNLNVSYNEISVFTPAMLMSFSKLNSVDIGGNPLDCNDLSVKYFKIWLGKNLDKVYNVDKNITIAPLTCAFSDINIIPEYDGNGQFTLSVSLGIGVPLFSIALLITLLGIKYRFQLLYMWHLLRVRRHAKQLKSVGQTNKFRFDAFVSYNHLDRDWVHEHLIRSLEGHETLKYALCLHERDFRLGAYIMDNVAECMEMSKHVIIVLSDNYIKSKWCQWELQLVQQLLFEKSVDFLVLIELHRLSPTKIPSTLRLLMSTRTYLEWSGEDASNVQHFWLRLKHVLGTPLEVMMTLHPHSEPSLSDDDVAI